MVLYANMTSHDSKRPYWGDLHNHNEVGYGVGTLERSYGLARASRLDVYAFTPHAWWPDLPRGDAAVERRHREGFELVERRWEEVRARANAANRDGEFTAFVAFEWHSAEWGDYHVLLPGAEGTVCRAATLGELQDWARRHGAILVPHHLGYRQGWRGANWGAWAADVSPVADGFSEHGCGIEADTHHAMLLHSMGGCERSQSLVEQWKAGRIVGVAGSTDNHWGCPGSYGEGLAGIWADGLSRTQVFSALRARHTYAVSGDRIRAWFEAEGGMMGDILPPGAPRRFQVDALCWNEPALCEVWKNGRPWRSAPLDQPSPRAPRGCHILRVEFGWDGMSSAEATDWTVRLRIKGGEIRDWMPAFCSGEAGVKYSHSAGPVSPAEFQACARTSRRNSRPVSGFALLVEGSRETAVDLEAETSRAGKPGGCRLRATLGEMECRTEWGAVTESFSAPRLGMGSVVSATKASCAAVLEDPDPSPSDCYHLRVEQRNGQCAWTSPIWFTDKNI